VPHIDVRSLMPPEPTGEPREEIERRAPVELKRVDIYRLAQVPRDKRTPHEPLGDTLKRAPVVLRIVARIEQWTARDGPRMQRQYGRSIALACRSATAVKHAALRLEELAAELDGWAYEDSADAGSDATGAHGIVGSTAEPHRIGGPLGSTPQEPRPSLLCSLCGQARGSNALACFECLTTRTRIVGGF
jgi:hypothetical protein